MVQGVQKRRRGLGWPTVSTSLPTFSPEVPAGLRPTTLLLHTLLSPLPHPLPTSKSSLVAAVHSKHHAAGQLEGGRANRPGAAGAAPSPLEAGGGRREEGRGGREREKEGPDGVSSQPIGGDRQVSAWSRDGSNPLGF